MFGYINFNEIENFGLSKSYVKIAIGRFNSQNSYSWDNIKDPKDKRKVLIKYDSIPETTIRKYKMPETYDDFLNYKYLQDLEAKELKAIKKIQIVSEREELESTRLFAEINNLLEIGFKEHIHTYTTKITYTKCSIENIKKEAVKCAKRHVLYNYFIEKTGGAYRTIKGSVKECHEFLSIYKKYYLLPENFTDYVQFSRKLSNFKKVVQDGTLHNGIVKENHYLKRGSLTSEFHRGVLMFYATNPKHYSHRQLAEFINHHAIEENMMQISQSWVAGILNDQYDATFRTLVDAGRRGEKYTNDNILPFLSRQESLYPNNTWFIDGTPVQFYYQDAKGNSQRLYLFVVQDACTRRIIGFDINSTGESRYMVMNAIKMAIRYTGYIPYEIVSDNFSANKTEEIKNLQSQLEIFGTTWRFAKVGNAQDKSYIERFIGTFQSMQQSMLEEYIGEGITSRRANGRIDADFIKNVIKVKGMYNKDKMKDFTVALLCIYNATSVGKRPSPNEKYNALAVDKATKLDMVNVPLLFWKRTEATVKRGQITLQRNNYKFEYDIWDKSLSLSLQSKKVSVRYDENHHGSVFIYDHITDNFIKEIKLKTKGFASNAEVTEGMEDVNIKFASHKKSAKNFIKDQQEIIIKNGLAQVDKTIENFEFVSALDLNKHHVNAKESLELIGLYEIEEHRKLTPINDYKQVGKTGKPTNKEYEVISRGANLLSKGTKKASKEMEL